VEEGVDCFKILPPKVLFIGEAHSGSTSLFNLLEFHPEIHGGDQKEHHYFDADMKVAHARSAGSFSEYKKQFCVPCNTTWSIDATMEYINLGFDKYGGHDMVKKVRAQLGSNLKIMMMVRDPVDLQFSEACQQTSHPKRPFTVHEPPNITGTTASKVEPLNAWLDVFPEKKNWLFLKAEDFFADQQKEADKVFKFLGLKSAPVVELSQDHTDQHGLSIANAGRRRCNIKANANERKAYFSVQENVDDQKELKKLTGLNLHSSA